MQIHKRVLNQMIKKNLLPIILILILISHLDICFSGEWKDQSFDTDLDVRDIWGSSASDVYAVGDNGTIYHYDGNSWTLVVVGRERLNSVWCKSPQDVYAVGDNGTIYHYDGNSWTSMNSGTDQNLNAVYGGSPTNLIAVGDNGTILYYNGIEWSVQESGTQENLNSISSIPIAWLVVGDNRTYIGSWQGVWSDSPYQLETGSNLNGMGGGYIVGDEGVIYNYISYPMQSGTSQDLNDAWGGSGGVSAFIVGDCGTILHYDDTLWSAMATGTDKNLYGIWGSVGNYDLFAVGEDGTILYYDGRAEKDESDDFGDSCEYATQVNINSTVEGKINFENDHDFFLIDVPSSGVLTIYTTGNTDTQLFIYDSDYSPSCDWTGQVGSGGPGDNFLYKKTFSEPHTFYISIMAMFGATGDYTLHVEFKNCDDAVPVDINTSSVISFDTGGVEFYSINLPHPGTLRAYTTGDDYTYGTIYSSDCSYMETGITFGSKKNFFKERYFSERTIYLAVSYKSLAEYPGSFTLHVEFPPDDAVSLFYAKPSYGYAGGDLHVTIYGKNTDFDIGTTVSFLSSGITVNSTTVNSPTKLISQITIDSEAVEKYCDVVVNTLDGNQIIETNAFKTYANNSTTTSVPETSTTTSAGETYNPPTGGGGGSSGSSNETGFYVMDESIDLGTAFSRWTFIIGTSAQGKAVEWETGKVTYNKGTGWITSVGPSSGVATYDRPDIVTVKVKREGFVPGIYTAEIPVTSNGEDASVLVRMEIESPLPVPDPEPECVSSSECNDDIFCNGEELCVSRKCIGGETPCSDEDICMEDLDQCWGVEKLTDLSLQKTIRKPGIRSQKCLWLVIGSEEMNNFDGPASTVDITGPEENSRGVTIDPARDALKAWDFILVPVCVEKDAGAGKWTVKIQTDVTNTEKPYKEFIESVFSVK